MFGNVRILGWVTGNGGGGGSDTFATDFTVSLSGGKTFGKYTNGQTVPAAGKTAVQVILMAAIEDIAPTYTPATISLSKSIANVAEVGTTYVNNTLNAVFTQNDAGALTNIRIQKNGSDILPNGSTSPFSKIDNGTYLVTPQTFQAFCNYNAGPVKNYTPSGTPDPRPPQIRSVNAPQAAENNFASNLLTIQGYYNYFYGPAAAAPTDSVSVRALPSSQLINAGNTFTLHTGTVQQIFAIAMPATKTLTQVFDATAGFDITSTFVLSTFNVNDAGGNPVSYNVYVLTNSVPYASDHTFNITTT